MLHISKVHFAKMTNFMEQKFIMAVAISEWLIHTAYDNRLSPGHVTMTSYLKSSSMSKKSPRTPKCSNLSTNPRTFFWSKHLTFTSHWKTLLSSSFMSPWFDLTIWCHCTSSFNYRSILTFPAMFWLHLKSV